MSKKPAAKDYIVITREFITPEIAQEWLNLNTFNRPLKAEVLAKYTRDMAFGRWRAGSAPIQWLEPDENGKARLANGQHRLWAIIESGQGQWFTIERGLKQEDVANIDTGSARSARDNLHFAGMEKATAGVMSCVRWVEWGAATVGKKIPSTHELGELLSRHREAAHFAVNHLRGKSIARAPITAAVARAWYVEENKESLGRFCRVMSTGQSEGEHESAAVTMRNLCIALAMRGVNSKDSGSDTFRRCQNAIAYFMRGKKLTVLRPIDVEAYPLKRKAAKGGVK